MSTAFTQARCTRYGLLIVVLAMVTACGGGSKKSGGTTSDSTTPVSTTPVSTTAATTASATSSTTDVAASTDQTSTSAASSSCTASDAVLAAAKKFPEITKVSLIGGCGEVSAATSLAPGALGSPSVTRAIAMCTAISKVAYVGSVYSVSVDGKDGHELATSTKGQQCI